MLRLRTCKQLYCSLKFQRGWLLNTELRQSSSSSIHTLFSASTPVASGVYLIQRSLTAAAKGLCDSATVPTFGRSLRLVHSSSSVQCSKVGCLYPYHKDDGIFKRIILCKDCHIIFTLCTFSARRLKQARQSKRRWSFPEEIR